MTSTPLGPGAVLAGRYRLEDLLVEHEGARFWRAEDQILARSVAVHVLDADDSRAVALQDAARTSATVSDGHILRVLDTSEESGAVFVVNEWGSGMSLDLMVSEGTLSARRAAWLVKEVAEAIATAHSHGVAHGRLLPENVLVSESGSVKLIGFVVDAVLNGRREPWCGQQLSDHESDVINLAGLLYTALVGRWPGTSGSSVPAAPMDHHDRPMRPRQVRAGIPRSLDAICQQTLDRGRDSHVVPIESAQEVVAALADFVGDPATAVDVARGPFATWDQEDTSPAPSDLDEPDVAEPGTAELRGPTEAHAADIPEALDPGPEPDGDATQAFTAADQPDPGPGGGLTGPDTGPHTGPHTRLRAGPAKPPAARPPSDAGSPDATGDETSEAPGPTAAEPDDRDSGGSPHDQGPRDPEATQLGAPVFYDDDTGVGWVGGASRRGIGSREPESPVEVDREKPLFAPGPPGRRGAERTGTAPADRDHSHRDHSQGDDAGHHGSTPVPSAGTVEGGRGHAAGPGGAGYWPWGAGPPEEQLPEEPGVHRENGGRSWLGLAGIVAAVVVLLIVIVAAFNLGRGQDAGTSAHTKPSSSAASSSPSHPVAIAAADDFDPLADPPVENPDVAGDAVDGDPSTGWYTSTYQDGPTLAPYKAGVGLMVDLGKQVPVSRVQVRLVGSPTGIELLAAPHSSARPTSAAQMTRLDRVADAGTKVTLQPDSPVTTRYLVLWLTKLPAVDGGYRGEIAEVGVRS